MLRQELLAALDRYLLRFPDEETVVRVMMDFVGREAGCFERSTTEGHITGSAWLVDPSGTRTLLTHHRKLGRWLQVGGHADGDGRVQEVARREAIEESGIVDLDAIGMEIFDVDIHTIPARRDEPEHLHYDVRYAFRARHDRHVVSAESLDLAWVPIDELHVVTTEPSILRMAEKWKTLS